MPASPRKNIFVASFGSNPPHLAGRQQETDFFLDLFGQLNDPDFDQLRSVLLIGPRGCGKTVLLQHIAEEALRHDINILDLGETILPGTGQELADQIYEPPDRTTVTAKGSAGVSLVAEARGEISTTREPHRAPPSSLVEAFAQHAGGRPLIILLDEAHEAPLDLLHDLYHAVQTAAKSFPVSLVAAGTPDTKHHLRNARASFTERSRTLHVGLLDDVEAVTAIAKPLREKGGYPITDDMAAQAAATAQNYPFFLQAAGEAIVGVVRERDADAVTEPILEEALTRTRAATTVFYRDRIKVLRDYGMLAGAAEVHLGARQGNVPDTYGVDDLISALAHQWRANGTTPPRGISANRLETAAEHLVLHTSSVWQPDDADPYSWSFAIPSLGNAATDAAVREIHRTFRSDGASKALGHLHQQGTGHAASLDALKAEAARIAGTGQTDADRFIDAMTEAGVIGPDGTTDADGKPRYSLLTPLLARLALDTPAQANDATLPPSPAPSPASRRKGPAPTRPSDIPGTDKPGRTKSTKKNRGR